ncbi:hypothetical protein ABT297_20445 [Dactylosporangium sp. NPDC000555]
MARPPAHRISEPTSAERRAMAAELEAERAAYAATRGKPTG